MWRKFLGSPGRRARWLGCLAVLLGLGCVLQAADNPTSTPRTPQKQIDLVICLDTSNSMDGLIASAKTKLWDIVNDLGKAKPAPNLRVALYSYGNDTYDAKIGWIRKELDFTTDLDKVNEKLFGLTTKGGTEYVTRVCRDAMEQLQWSADRGALKMIFVCGNEPANQDPEVKIKPIAEMAARKGVIINTIYCGNPADSDAVSWKEFADLAEGRFASINQERGAVAIATPVDKELAELSSKVNSTFCFSGREAKALAANQVAQDANAAQAGGGVAAARAASKSWALYRFKEDLVDRAKSDPKFDVKKLAEDEVPDELKKMTPEEREKHIKGLVAQRDELQKNITELTKKREEYVKEETKKNPSKGDKAFDEAVRGLLREQCKRKGIEIP